MIERGELEGTILKVRNGLLYVIMMILCVGCGPQQQAGENTGREAIVSATAVEKPAIRQMKTIKENGEYMVSEYDPDGKLLSETYYDAASNETGKTATVACYGFLVVSYNSFRRAISSARRLFSDSRS